jgi:hypothetical protein
MHTWNKWSFRHGVWKTRCEQELKCQDEHAGNTHQPLGQRQLWLRDKTLSKLARQLHNEILEEARPRQTDQAVGGPNSASGPSRKYARCGKPHT